jgi:DNA (cytosine-5)-methyltransferase 1
MSALQLVEHGSPKPLRSLTIDRLCRPSRQPTLISLFSGCGGAALGACMAGFEVRVFVEWDKHACATLARNFCDRRQARRLGIKQRRVPAILQADITKLPTAEILKAADLEIGEADCLEGGFPCQGFSTMNSRADRSDHTKDKRNLLYKELIRVIREALPRHFMLENVPGLVSMEKGAVIKMICEELAACGFNVQWDILNAADFGVPQNRRRVFFLGDRVDVMTIKRSRLGLHMGAVVGRIRHPEWFIKKYPNLFRVAPKVQAA